MTIGVGGLTLGSGISYTSPRYGWTCDTVSEFQIVLADGSIVEADSKSRPDLLWALKGGSNNFGSELSFSFFVSIFWFFPLLFAVFFFEGCYRPGFPRTR